MRIKARKAVLKDCGFIYECRNDDGARKNARNIGYITPEEHDSWFRKTLEDKGVSLYVGEAEAERIGWVRFTYGSPTEVAIFVHPSKRGKGYGTVLLQSAIDDFLDKSLEERTLMATIRPSNMGSRRIFEKVGFKANGEKDPKDDGFDVYILSVGGR